MPLPVDGYEILRSQVKELPEAARAQLAAICLESLEPGFQPGSLFAQLARLVVTNTVEVVPLLPRKSSTTPRVILSQRTKDDPWWPNVWHVPGVVVLPTDAIIDRHDFTPIVNRLFKSEFRDRLRPIEGAHHVETIRREGARGSEVTEVVWTTVKVDSARLPEHVQSFDPEEIFESGKSMGLLEGHDITIRNALAHYAATLPNRT